MDMAEKCCRIFSLISFFILLFFLEKIIFYDTSRYHDVERAYYLTNNQRHLFHVCINCNGICLVDIASNIMNLVSHIIVLNARCISARQILYTEFDSWIGTIEFHCQYLC